MLSKVQKRELAWYKVALAAFESNNCYYTHWGVCETLKYEDIIFRREWSDNRIHSKILLPTLYKLSTRPLGNAYWFYNKEERIEALNKAIETLEKEDTPKEYSKTLVVAVIIVVVVALFYIVKLSLSNA